MTAQQPPFRENAKGSMSGISLSTLLSMASETNSATHASASEPPVDEPSLPQAVPSMHHDASSAPHAAPSYFEAAPSAPHSTRPRFGVVDAGGGERGVYGAGVFDRCLDDGVAFDLCIGVSAGSANTITYLAGQRGRTKRFYLDYAFRKQYMSVGNLLRTGSYVDLDYVYSTLSNEGGEDPLDYRAVAASGKRLEVVAADALTGRARYFDNDDLALNNYDALKASSSLPVVGPPYAIDGVPYYDGGLVDPIPAQRALDQGCERIVVVLTRPRDFYRSSTKDRRMARLLRRKHPAMAQALEQRADLYNRQLDEAKQLEAEGRALIVAPVTIDGIGTLTKDRAKLEHLYEMGYADGGAIKGFLA